METWHVVDGGVSNIKHKHTGEKAAVCGVWCVECEVECGDEVECVVECNSELWNSCVVQGKGHTETSPAGIDDGDTGWLGDGRGRRATHCDAFAWW